MEETLAEATLAGKTNFGQGKEQKEDLLCVMLIQILSKFKYVNEIYNSQNPKIFVVIFY